MSNSSAFGWLPVYLCKRLQDPEPDRAPRARSGLGAGRRESLTTAFGGDRSPRLLLSPTELASRGAAVSKRGPSQRRRNRNYDTTLVRRPGRASRIGERTGADTQGDRARYRREEVLVSRSERRGKALCVSLNRHERNLYEQSARSRAFPAGDDLDVRTSFGLWRKPRNRPARTIHPGPGR